MPELLRPARTLDAWRKELPNSWTRAGSRRVSNGPTEATNTQPPTAGSLGVALSTDLVAAASIRLFTADVNENSEQQREAADPVVLQRPAEVWVLQRALEVAGGTDQIQQSIIGEQLLGLPR